MNFEQLEGNISPFGIYLWKGRPEAYFELLIALKNTHKMNGYLKQKNQMNI